MVFVGRRTWCVGFLRFIHLQRCLFLHLSRAKSRESDLGLWMRRSPGRQGYRVNRVLVGQARAHSSHRFPRDADEPGTNHTLIFFSFLVSVVELRASQAF